MKRFLVGFGLAIGLSAVAVAQDAGQSISVEAPPPPPQMQSGQVMEPDAMEPEVTIQQTPQGKVEEYRLNGRVYMVKVSPAAGKPYYLLDTNGDGELDVREDSIYNVAVPQWVIFSW